MKIRFDTYILAILMFTGICLGNTQTVAEELFGYINLDDSRLVGVKQKYQAGQYTDALNEYKDIFLDRAAQLALSDMLAWNSNPDDVLNNNIVRMYNLEGGYESQNIGAPGSINWYQTTDFEHWTYYLSNMSWAGCLVDRYAANPAANGQYLEKWAAIWVDFSQNNYDQWLAIRGTALESQYGGLFVNIWLHRLILGDRIRYLLSQFSAAVKADAATTKSLITGEQLAIILNEMTQRNMPRLNSTIHGGVPNQVISSALGMMQCGLSFTAFKDADIWRATGEYEANDYLNMSYMPDGTDMEQSFNYNGAMISVGREIVDLYQSSGESIPVWVNDFQNAMSSRLRFLASIVRPNGMLPSLDLQNDADALNALSGHQSYINDALVARILDNVWTVNPTLPLPAFNSVYFPYGGYCVLRDGWNGSANHLFMKNSRMGKGHYDQSSNQVQITAFGRTMLIDSGGSLYVSDYRNGYFQNSFGHNTILVDGKSQIMGGERSPAYDTTIDARFHTSAEFDFIEGAYGNGINGGYGTNGVIEINDVTHRREVSFVRGANVYIIADRLISGLPHTYTQIWNYDKSYQKTEVNLAAANKIITNQAYQPNVAIYNFSPAALSYTKYHGYYDGQNVFGWAKDGAGYIQAVDTHRSWAGAGEQLLLTLVVPMYRTTEGLSVLSQSATDDIIQFEAQTTAGINIKYAARKTAGQITLGNIIATAKSLLVKTAANGVSKCIVLDCQGITVGGVEYSTVGADFEFTTDGQGGFTVDGYITKPQGFVWQQSGQSLEPRYENVQYNLTVSSQPSYAVSIAPSSGSYQVASNTAVNFQADDFVSCPYIEKFAYWLVNGQQYSGQKNISIEINENTDVTAVFNDDRKCGDQCHPLPGGDINGDCRVNIEDIKVILDNWLETSL